MSSTKPEDIRERAFRFTCDLFDYCEDIALISGMSRRVAYQLFDAGGAIGANLEEAKAAYSRKEFAAKNAIALKESRESRYWLRVSNAKSLGEGQTRLRLLDESNQLVSILTTIVRRLQG